SFVALEGSSIRLLVGQTQLPEQAPDVDLAVPYAELALDQQPYPLERPQRRSKAACRSAFEQHHIQPGQFGCAEFWRPPTRAHVAQRIDAAGFEHLAPAVYGLSPHRPGAPPPVGSCPRAATDRHVRAV